MKILKYIGAGLLLILVVMQFINRSEKIAEPVTDNDIAIVLQLDEEVSDLLTSSCYDCHSNQPKYPWYANVAPVSWILADHVEEGREELNFSEWGNYPAERQDHKLEEILEEVGEGKMPLEAYLDLHAEAEITPEKLALFKTWVDQERAKLKK